MNPRVSKSFGTAGTLCNMEREAEKWGDERRGKFCSISYVILSYLGSISKANKNN